VGVRFELRKSDFIVFFLVYPLGELLKNSCFVDLYLGCPESDIGITEGYLGLLGASDL
jgi:hypothetical protein